MNAAVTALSHVVAARREQGAAPEAAGENLIAACEELRECARRAWLASLYTNDSDCGCSECGWTAPVAG